MRQAVAKNPEYPPILFFYQGTVAQGESFFAKRWPEARAVADLSLHFYHAFGIERARLTQLIGPSVVFSATLATSKGHFQGKPVGDTKMMPGLVAVQGENIIWQHNYDHVGDHPDFEDIPERIKTNNK